MSTLVRVQTLAQLGQNDSWKTNLIHVQKAGLLLWVTRGQGVINLHGVRRGFSTHNAIYIPPAHLCGFDIGRQTMGQAVVVAPELAQGFPKQAHLLRVKDSLTQSELTSLIEDMRREIQNDRAYLDETLQAQSALLGVWLRRQLDLQPPQGKPAAAERLVLRFCDLVARDLGSGKVMADYAETLRVTPTHLTRVCRQTAGMTAADILTQTLLHEARARLLGSHASIKAISESLNFGSAPYFTRFIQHHSGATPSQLRQAAQKAARVGISSPR